MAFTDILTSNLATFNRAAINSMISVAKTNKLTLDKFSNYYLLEDTIKIGFPMLKKYDNILRSSLVDYTIEKDRYYRPEYVSYDLYGTTDLWYLIMYVNHFYRIEDFVGPTIKIPAYDPLTVINAIVNDEVSLVHGSSSPLPIQKNYLKHPSEKSDRITRDLPEKHIPWVRGATILTQDKFPWTSSFFRSEYYLTSGTLKDSNGNGVKAITLDSEGTTSIPSVYFRDGYEKTLAGRVYLEKNSYYSLWKNLSGGGEFKVSKDGKEVSYEKFSQNFGEALLISDSRAANVESTTGDSSIYSSVINFDDDLGVYKFRSLVSSMKEKLLEEGIYLTRTVFSANEKKPRLDVNRLNGASSIGANIIYSFNLGTIDFLQKLDHLIYVYYEDGAVEVSDPSTPRIDIVDTHGVKSVLKIAVPSRPGKTITEVEVRTLFKFKKAPATNFNLEYNLYGVHLFKLMDETSLTVPFKPKTTDWYDFSVKYTYQTRDENGYELYPDDLYHGINFNPKEVRVLDGVTVDRSFTPRINDGGNQTSPILTSLQGPTITVTSTDTSRDVHLYTGSLVFPEEFMLTLKLDHKSLSKGGGVGFVFNYDKKKEQGYLLWISSTGSNPNLPLFAKDGGQNILRTGFYELDSIEGTKYPIFNGDSLTSISVSNYRPLEINGRYLKIIRHLNRIRIYPTDANGSLTSETQPLLDLQDISNYHTGGGWQVLATYATASLTISCYETWKKVGLIDKGSDW